MLDAIKGIENTTENIDFEAYCAMPCKPFWMVSTIAAANALFTGRD